LTPPSAINKGPFRLVPGTPLFRAGKTLLVWSAALLVLNPSEGWTRGQNWRFHEIRVKDGKLRMHFAVSDLFNREVFETLQKGMSAAVEYHVRLWKEQDNWADQLMSDDICRMKIAYDSWEKRYIVTLRDGSMKLVNEDGVWEHCARLNGYPLIDVEKLEEPRRYRIEVKVTFQPMSIENVQDIKHWLSGKPDGVASNPKKESKPSLKRARDWLLGLVVNASGFGDRVIMAESLPFAWKDGAVSVEEEK
jgi:hypothetical protein